MPRRNPVPVRELVIAKRLKSVRAATLLSRRAYCSRIAVDYWRYSNYELGKVPLSYEVGDLVCRREGINQRWLVSGREPWHQYIPIPEDLASLIQKKATFSSVCEGLLEVHLAKSCSTIALHLEGRKQRIVAERNEAEGRLAAGVEIDTCVRELREMLRLAPPQLLGSLMGTIRLAAFGFLRLGAAVRLADSSNPLTNQERNILQEDTASGNQSGVKAQWPQLKKKLQQATELKGQRAALADFLGVTRPSVSRWLSDGDDAREPGAETALQMIRWLERESK